MNDAIWFVAHTRARCEKKLVQYCAREGIDTTLPCYKADHRYRGKVAEFEKPLFPGYVFLRMPEGRRQQVFQSDYVANVLDVFDQGHFESQLNEIMRALQTSREIQLAPEIGQGARVRLKSGPLRGMEGWVEDRYGPSVVLLRLDFIGQAAAVSLQADELELA